MEQFIALVEKTGFFVLNLPQWGTRKGYQAEQDGDCIRAIVHSESRTCFLTISVPMDVVVAGDTKAVKAIIEGKLGVGVSR